MSLATRLGRLTPALTARERAVLMLRAFNAGVEPDPEIMKSMPKEQSREYNRYAGLSYAVNADLGALLNVIRMRIDSLEYDHQQVETLKEAGGILAQELEETPSDKKVRAWRRQKLVSVPEFLLGLAHELELPVRQEVIARWHELRALELVWDEIAREFDGEDVAHPDHRANHADAGQRLHELAAKIGMPRKAFTEPSEELVESTRGCVTQPMRAMHLIHEELP